MKDVVDVLNQRITELEAENERLRKVMDAASCIRHWHDSGKDGMVVSAEHVRKLWSALDDAMREGEGEESDTI